MSTLHSTLSIFSLPSLSLKPSFTLFSLSLSHSLTPSPISPHSFSFLLYSVLLDSSLSLFLFFLFFIPSLHTNPSDTVSFYHMQCFSLIKHLLMFHLSKLPSSTFDLSACEGGWGQLVCRVETQLTIGLEDRGVVKNLPILKCDFS